MVDFRLNSEKIRKVRILGIFSCGHPYLKFRILAILAKIFRKLRGQKNSFFGSVLTLSNMFFSIQEFAEIRTFGFLGTKAETNQFGPYYITLYLHIFKNNKLNLKCFKNHFKSLP